ncbi:YciI family protein [Acanthopleuribacter pedis]|uniref:YciI family protein n=1 Tax=Acanthopleuribacter pedis TaxID=442870 RepID=A0A8J7Q2K9_9BACT|nr:YciI family protein [Acanthopleuribacter pedis]MBO1319402.1 YciI family protein [Acanthopleuribacter pedis]
MLYSVLIYDSEPFLAGLPAEEHEQRLQEHLAFQDNLRDKNQLGAVVKLAPTAAAVTVRRSMLEDVVVDGPFAETKEHLIGFYLVEAANLEEAVSAARQLPIGGGALEIRPVAFFEGGDFRQGDALVLRGD